jgi:hypothetical protein
MMTSPLRCTERLKAEDGKVSLLVDQPCLTELCDLGRLGMTVLLTGGLLPRSQAPSGAVD